MHQGQSLVAVLVVVFGCGCLAPLGNQFIAKV